MENSFGYLEIQCKDTKKHQNKLGFLYLFISPAFVNPRYYWVEVPTTGASTYIDFQYFIRFYGVFT